MDHSFDGALRRRNFLRLSAAAVAVAATGSALRATGGLQASAGDRTKTICVLGASGNVGNAIVRELLAANHRVIAVSRSAEKLAKIRAAYSHTKRIETCQGDVSSDELAARLREALGGFGRPHAIVASLSSHGADVPMRILDTSTNELKQVFDTNFFSHVTAAHALIPALAPDGVYVGINGGLADFVLPNRGQLSMTQSALRTLYSVLAQEAQDSKAAERKVQVRLLQLYGLVATDRNRAQANDGWITDQQVGARVSEIIAEPASFPGPILALKAKKYS